MLNACEIANSATPSANKKLCRMAFRMQRSTEPPSAAAFRSGSAVSRNGLRHALVPWRTSLWGPEPQRLAGGGRRAAAGGPWHRAKPHSGSGRATGGTGGLGTGVSRTGRGLEGLDGLGVSRDLEALTCFRRKIWR